MQGLAIIVTVALVGVYFLVLGIRYARRNALAPQEKKQAWEKMAPFFMWGSTTLYAFVLLMTARQLQESYGYKGAALAQSDFALFWVFALYVLPASCIILVSMGLIVRYWPRGGTALQAKWYSLNIIVDVAMLLYGMYLYYDFRWVFMPLKFGK